MNACHKHARPIIMALAEIGGLMTSTVLSLLVIPAVFTVVDDFGNWVKRLVFRGVAGQK